MRLDCPAVHFELAAAEQRHFLDIEDLAVEDRYFGELIDELLSPHCPAGVIKLYLTRPKVTVSPFILFTE